MAADDTGAMDALETSEHGARAQLHNEHAMPDALAAWLCRRVNYAPREVTVTALVHNSRLVVRCECGQSASSIELMLRRESSSADCLAAIARWAREYRAGVREKRGEVRIMPPSLLKSS